MCRSIFKYMTAKRWFQVCGEEKTKTKLVFSLGSAQNLRRCGLTLETFVAITQLERFRARWTDFEASQALIGAKVFRGHRSVCTRNNIQTHFRRCARSWRLALTSSSLSPSERPIHPCFSVISAICLREHP